MEPSLDNRQLEMLFDIAKEKENNDVMEEIFRLISEQAYFLTCVNFSKKPVIQKDGSLLLEKNTDIKFPLLANSAKETYYPAFSSRMELDLWKQDLEKTTILTLCIDDYVDLLRNDPSVSGIVINPFNQSFIVSKEMLEHVLDVRHQNKPFDKRHTILQDLQRGQK